MRCRLIFVLAGYGEVQQDVQGGFHSRLTAIIFLARRKHPDLVSYLR